VHLVGLRDIVKQLEIEEYIEVLKDKIKEAKREYKAYLVSRASDLRE
jgi:RNA polymerase-interacting CarD/CdnL/TRCF family regulator